MAFELVWSQHSVERSVLFAYVDRCTGACRCLHYESSGVHGQWRPLWIATATDPQLRQTWGQWFNAQIMRHGERELQLEKARFAADSVWMGQMFGDVPGHPETLKNNHY